MALSISGQGGVVRWSYHTAATLGPWTLTADASGGTLTARVVSADTFKLAQPDLTFRWTRQNGPASVWPIHSLQIADGTLHARVSTQE